MMSTPPTDFTLTPRQRRLRAVMAVILLFLVAMVIAWFANPFFRAVQPGPISEAMRKAIQLKLLVIGCYITTMFLMALSLVLLAWLDMRETRLKGLKAQVEMWKDVSERSRDRHGKPSNQ